MHTLHQWRMALLGESSERSALMFGVAAVLILFFSSYHLFQSPETWLDEGLIMQSAIGLLHTGKAALPVAPGVYEPAWYITTGFPVTIPLAGAFTVFGVSIEAARIVMLLYILAFFSALWVFARRAIGGTAAWLGLFFIVFFGPVYGHGRNVLGEVPGLFFILLALLPLIAPGPLSTRRALLSGLGAGLAFATKPIFILFLPALLAACLLRRNELELRRVFFVGVAGVLIPSAVWLLTQFDAVSLVRVVAVYANPHDVDVWSAIVSNVTRFLTESQPLYFAGALLVWTGSYVLRRVRRVAVPLVEEALLFFSFLVLAAYVRNAGYYRYFFPAQVFALLYLPQSLLYLASLRSPYLTRAAALALSALLAFAAYETSFRSWTAVHYDSLRTAALKSYFEKLPDDAEVFVYQAPEIAPFGVDHPTYQYVSITPSIDAGRAYRERVIAGDAPRVLTPTEFFQDHESDVFSRYRITAVLDNYVELAPRSSLP